MTPEREIAHLRYQLAAQAAAGAERDRVIARLRAEVARLKITAGEAAAPAPIPEPPAAPSRMAPPEPPKPLRANDGRKHRVRGGWLLPFLRQHGPMTAEELAKASGRPIGVCRKILWKSRAELARERTGNGPEVRYAAAG